MSYDGTYLLTDEQVAQCCLPVLFDAFPDLDKEELQSHTLIIPSGEKNKSPETLQRIWQFLFSHHASRSSLLVTLGGGMVSDIGGLAAATFMRGMSYINIPTTLLAMADAGIGGKTAVNLTLTEQNRLVKNAVGVVYPPLETRIHLPFLVSLPPRQILSGYAEMLKTALVTDRQLYNQLLEHEQSDTQSVEFRTLLDSVVAVKSQIVEQDPYDHGTRRILNFGHTVGHAIEAWVQQRQDSDNYPHGVCVVYGMVAAAYISHALCGFPSQEVSLLCRWMLENTPAVPFRCSDFDELTGYMSYDKKQTHDAPHFVLLQDIAAPLIQQSVPDTLIREALEYVCSAG